MGAFLGQLRTNEIYSALFNMIIGQEIFGDKINVSGNLVDEARIDGGLYGDTKLFYDVDVLPVHPWGVDANHAKGGVMDVEAANLLALDRPDAPECQAITLDTFRQIRLTLDDYISKRAWSDESTFAKFTALMESMMTKSKAIYDKTLYDCFIGTTSSSTGSQAQEIDLSGASTDEAEAKLIAEKIANILVDMKDVNRAYNDYGHMSAFSNDQIKIIWNSKYVNKIKKIDLPEIFHKEGLIDKFEQKVLHEKYFGTVNSTDVAGDGQWVRALEPGFATKSGEDDIFVFGGELVPTGFKMGAGKTYSTGTTESSTDIPDKTICKIYVKLPPYMSAFEVGSSFYNPRSLTTNRYLTWGHNTLEYLKAYPLVTLSEADD